MNEGTCQIDPELTLGANISEGASKFHRAFLHDHRLLQLTCGKELDTDIA